ncbi:MAG TPA: protein phosphatase 2C domain-containing protein [Longimicrobiaceae bacterium]|nr:protein phosphatase 2C domain-containing protein [Longimicrobiaceae bacterium]
MTVERVGPVRIHGMIFEVAGLSAQGPRPENQDALAVSGFEGAGLLAVADGMGGERAGRMAADTALAALAAAAPVRSLDAARYAVRAADEAVARAAAENAGEREGMGCALALLSLVVARDGHAGWVGAHVGDVRILSRAPDGTVRLETRDHTPAFARWEAGEIALDEIPDTVGANKLQRAVGRGGEADASWIPARPGWSWLIVSDGVTKAMRLDELGAAMALPPAEGCEAIARKVEERGPDDNYTVVAVRVVDESDQATVPHPRAAVPAAAGADTRTLEAPPRRATVFDPPTPVTRTAVRSPWGPVAALLSLLALALAGYALWSVLQARPAGDSRAALDSLRARVDSLAARLPPDTTAAVVGAGDSVPPFAPGTTPPARNP